MAKLIWYVWEDAQSGMPMLFDTKEAAEKYARLLFPDESPDTRYARVYFRALMTMDDLL